ncbi:DUF3566 domain-containing protein [Gordonia asplenii]|uniref:DUF3566 domain-containing protein n=1 Tax=Gordonia asplenii TaxID=2725283 RepID=UPI001FEB5B79|nr:DUF3566 domain-containing protein [Gordonia asplenii]
MSTANEPDEHKVDGAGSSSGGQAARATVVPPWQRGQAATATESSETESGERGGPPPRGVVSGTPRGEASASDDADAPTPTTPPASGERKPDTFVESPTRHIDRSNVATQNLPDLDAIHHAESAKAAKAVPTSTRSIPAQVGPGRALRASVQIRRIDPWAMFKISAVLSIVGFFVWLISVAVLYLILDGMGVWDQVNSSFGTLTTADGSSGGGDIFGAGTIFGWAVGLGAINAILLTALATIGAFIYNLCADLIGGAEVTLADLD